ncbi:MAG: hypothetical protein ACRC24_02885 [Vibrionaceae bacterium]
MPPEDLSSYLLVIAALEILFRREEKGNAKFKFLRNVKDEQQWQPQKISPYFTKRRRLPCENARNKKAAKIDGYAR